MLIIFFVVYLNILSEPQNIYRRKIEWLMNRCLEWMWKEAVVIFLMVQYMEGLRNTTKILSQDSESPDLELGLWPEFDMHRWCIQTKEWYLS
jgi:hypothetical protein